MPYLRLEALDEVTTVPALAWGGLPSALEPKLLRGEKLELVSESEVPHFPETQNEE